MSAHNKQTMTLTDIVSKIQDVAPLGTLIMVNEAVYNDRALTSIKFEIKFQEGKQHE